MLDHLSLKVRDLGRSKTFYAAVLAPLGAGVQMEYEGGCGLGTPGKPSLWLSQGDPPSLPVHLALVAPDRPAVDAFHAAAIAAGAADNGAPGLRPDYHPSYYAAFVIDPDGHNLEAVCHTDPSAAPARPAAGGARRAAKGASRGKSASRAKGAPASRAGARKTPRASATKRKAAPRKPARRGKR